MLHRILTPRAVSALALGVARGGVPNERWVLEQRLLGLGIEPTDEILRWQEAFGITILPEHRKLAPLDVLGRAFKTFIELDDGRRAIVFGELGMGLAFMDPEGGVWLRPWGRHAHCVAASPVTFLERLALLGSAWSTQAPLRIEIRNRSVAADLARELGLPLDPAASDETARFWTDGATLLHEGTATDAAAPVTSARPASVAVAATLLTALGHRDPAAATNVRHLAVEPTHGRIGSAPRGTRPAKGSVELPHACALAKCTGTVQATAGRTPRIVQTERCQDRVVAVTTLTVRGASIEIFDANPAALDSFLTASARAVFARLDVREDPRLRLDRDQLSALLERVGLPAYEHVLDLESRAGGVSYETGGDRVQLGTGFELARFALPDAEDPYRGHRHPNGDPLVPLERYGDWVAATDSAGHIHIIDEMGDPTPIHSGDSYAAFLESVAARHQAPEA